MQNVQDQEVLDVSEVKVCSPDHDYIELMVKVKEEDESDCVVDDLLKETKESKFLKTKKRTPRKKKFAKQIADPQIQPDPFFNLSQLAEVSLAMEGRSEDQDLNQRVQQAAARAAKATEPSARPIPAILASLTPQPLPGSVVLPQQPMPLPDVSRPGGQRTMQIVLPDNASHIIMINRRMFCSFLNDIHHGRCKIRIGVANDNRIRTKRLGKAHKTGAFISNDFDTH